MVLASRPQKDWTKTQIDLDLPSRGPQKALVTIKGSFPWGTGSLFFPRLKSCCRSSEQIFFSFEGRTV